MNTKRKVNPLDIPTGWITSRQASAILSKKHERSISEAYVRRLAGMGIITVKAESERKKFYWQKDVEDCDIKEQGDGSVRRATRGKKG